MVKKILIAAGVLFFVCLSANVRGGIFAMDDKIVVLETNQGTIEIRLMSDIAPKACENFMKLAIRN